ncbi:hypothetical protein HWC14_gp21 [Serratia phage Parlo]|uniref:Uncharacterized protein n=1 Tax=Serratia phage Parlo TaxID=2557554 RepID=A0A482MG99_9CAUD|nr:hypothetical protein HWC14_gp21 [Serratia phage Parlo]QBQ72170.1 hypothetical protein CPT_Parlo_021 [Serratia phage Parlo]HEJ7283090.1 hypothetical protein [Serratia marcescens]
MQDPTYTASGDAWPTKASWRIPVPGGKFVYFVDYPTMREKQCVEVQFKMLAHQRTMVQRRR